MTGRPSDYTDEIANEICERIAKGESLRKSCGSDRDDFMPGRRTVLEWLEVNEGFRAKYARAREAQADHLADEMLEIADAPNATTNPVTGETELRDPQRDRLRVMTRQWIASKLAPKRYGDKVTQEHVGPDGGAVKFERIAYEIIDPKATDA